MITKKDIDSKWVRQIDTAISDLEALKDQINTLNQNDDSIEKSLKVSIENLKVQTAKSVNDLITSLNDLIDKEDSDVDAIYGEIKKIHTLLELKEKDSNNKYDKATAKIDEFLKTITNSEGYLKVEAGRLKSIKLPEDRILSDKFRVETVTEIIKEQPIIQEVEKKVTPTITKSQLEHYYDYGVRLSEEVMAPKHIQGYDKLQVDVELEEVFKSPGNLKINLYKFIKTLLIVMLEDGYTEISNTVKGTLIYKGNIIKEIEDQLSIRLSAGEITTIHPQGTGFFIATLNNGVLFYNIVDKTISTRMIEDGVVYIEQYDDKTLVISEVISVYNDDMKRVFVSKLLANKGLKPLKVEKLIDGRIVVLCGGHQKGLSGNLFMFKFENGELIQRYIYVDPFDRRDTYFYNITSDSKTASIIGNRDGDYVNAIYDLEKIEERYTIRYTDSNKDLLNIVYNNVNDDYLMVFEDKLILNEKVIYGVQVGQGTEVIFRDVFAYLVNNNNVTRFVVTPDEGTAFKFSAHAYGEGHENKLIIKKDSKEVPVVRVAGKSLETHVVANYVYVTGIVPGDIVEFNTNGAIIDDIAIYTDYTLVLDKKEG